VTDYAPGPPLCPRCRERVTELVKLREIEDRHIRGVLAVYCPHSNTAHFQGAAPDEVWLEGHLEWLRLADVVVVLVGGERSSGTVAEVQEALRLGIPVFWGSGWRITDVSRDPDTGEPFFDGPLGTDLFQWIKAKKEAQQHDYQGIQVRSTDPNRGL